MVESQPKTQLPTAMSVEESKEEKVFMCGNASDMLEDIKDRLKPVELNQLEEGLLQRFLSMDDFKDQVFNLLLRVRARNEEDSYYLRKIDKVLPFFKDHEFWSYQPVPKYYEAVPEAAYNSALETKTVDEVQA